MEEHWEAVLPQSLSQSGVKIAILDLTQESAQRTVDAIKKEGGSAIGFAANVLSEKSITSISKEILKQWGRVDILLNAAGGNMPGATIAVDQTIFDLSMDDFKKVTELNLNGSVIPSLVFGKIMADQKSGSIINYSSMSVDRVITRVVGLFCIQSGNRKLYPMDGRRNGPEVWTRCSGKCNCSRIFCRKSKSKITVE